MAENKYTQALDNIKAPKGSVDRAVNAALDAERRRTASGKSAKGRSVLLKITAAAAAIAVMTCSVTAAVMLSGKNRNSGSIAAAPNWFSLSVNASEVNKSNVNIGRISCGENMMAYTLNTPENDTDESNIDESTIKDLTISPEINFAVRCQGNNIKYVSYQIEGAALSPMNLEPVAENSVDIGFLDRYSRYIDIIEKSFNKPYDQILKEVDHGSDSIETPAFVYALRSLVYSTLTLRYDDQPVIIDKTEDELFEEYGIDGPPSLNIITDGAYSWDPDLKGASKDLIDSLVGKTSAEVDEFESAAPDTDHGRLKNAFIKEQLEKVKLTITVTYEDGETETCIMQLSPGKQSENSFEMDVNARLIMVKDESSDAESDAESAYAEDSFKLMANNMILSEDNAVSVSTLDLSGVNTVGLSFFSLNKNDDGTLSCVMNPELALPVVCTGTDVESVTYNVSGAGLMYDQDKLSSVSEKNVKLCTLQEYYSGLITYDDYPESWNRPVFSSVTLNEKDQKSSGLALMLHSTSWEGYENNETMQKYNSFFKTVKSFDDFISFRNNELSDLSILDMIEAMLKDVSLEMVINFKDGNSISRSILLFPGDFVEANDSSKISISAKLA